MSSFDQYEIEQYREKLNAKFDLAIQLKLLPENIKNIDFNNLQFKETFINGTFTRQIYAIEYSPNNSTIIEVKIPTEHLDAFNKDSDTEKDDAMVDLLWDEFEIQSSNKRGNYKKSPQFLAKAAAKRAREAADAKSLQEDFDEWFGKYCNFIVQEPQLRIICSHLRKNKLNSYQQYCERNNKPFLNKKGFDAAIKEKCGSVPVQGTGNHWRFNHIDFVSGE